MKIGFASDLHINEEEWTLDVLRELLENSPPFLILGGDVFDSFDCLQRQKDSFISIIKRASVEKIFFLPGNHDISGGSLNEIENIDFGDKIIPITQTPYLSMEMENKEFVFVPFQKDLSLLYSSEIKSKTVERIFIGHGSLIDYNLGNEEENAFFDRGFFKFIEADFVLLGHIHNSYFSGGMNFSGKINKEINLFYPGSARFWRKGETGKHGFLIFDLDEKSYNFIELKKGGEYLEIKIIVDEDKYNIPLEVENINENSFVEFIFEGIVYNSSIIEEIINELRMKYEDIARRLYFNEINIVNISNYYNSEVFKAFMEKWKKHYANALTEEEKENYLLARKLFVQELQEIFGGNID